MLRPSLTPLMLLLPLACGDSGARGETGSASASASATASTTGGTSEPDPDSTGSTAAPPTTSGASQTAGETTTTGATTSPGTATTNDPTDTTTATTTTTTASTGEPACEDQPEECDALDNNCNDLFDEGCDCTPPDLELTAIDGYTARVVLTVDKDLVGNRPAGRAPATSAIVQAAASVTRALGIEVRMDEGSTDANYPQSLGIPAITIDGGGRGTGAHALDEAFDTTDAWKGTQRALLLAVALAQP